MIKEAIECLLERYVQPRAKELVIEDSSGRRFLYDDNEHAYKPIDRWNQRQRSVSNVESLAAMVLEEARRAKNPTGDWMTVIFSLKGAQLFITDQDTRTVFGYDRQLSPQWELLVGSAHRGMGHKDFVRTIQALRPSIVKYADILAEFRNISFGAGVMIDSEPVMQKGRGGYKYQLVLRATRGKDKDSTVDVDLSPDFELQLQYARGSQAKYSITAEVDVSLLEGREAKTVQFSLLLPDKQNVEEQAIADEIKWFRDQVKGLPQLHILEDY